MAGHSKWANIKHRKGAQDKKRGKLFTKLIKEIHVAVKESGPDPDGNPRLRLAVQNAKGQNVPKDTIERAVKKAAGEGGETYITQSFEGTGPKGVAIFVECMTDNTNRTVKDVRHAISKYQGKLGTNGSTDFIFERKGIFEIEIPEDFEFEADELELELIDGGADEVALEGRELQITTAMEDFGNMQKKLEEIGLEAKAANLIRIPNNYVELADEEFIQMSKMIDMLEDFDDVQQVFHNMDIKDDQISLLED
ncbi:YebC/PmpR family DNA-binding transcriptional regulator [Persicobacter diffluens]|uniref:Probable transcriptional regulatory protein PEDI_21140 n=1 Tax=Persicobacter diffluens TaxID=981 RepID=A0AAN4VZH4_9BACT|nr:putative transcriptional regulatory protein [Persicobacter diffluens]